MINVVNRPARERKLTSSGAVLKMTSFYLCVSLIAVLPLSTVGTWVSMLTEQTQIYSILSVGYPWCYSSLQAWNSFVPSIWLIAFWRALFSGANVLFLPRGNLQQIWWISHLWFDFIPALDNAEGYTPKENVGIDAWVTMIQKLF